MVRSERIAVARLGRREHDESMEYSEKNYAKKNVRSIQEFELLEEWDLKISAEQ